MARIKIEDLPEDMKISKEEMKKVMGGVEPTTFPVITTGSLSKGITGVNLRGMGLWKTPKLNPLTQRGIPYEVDSLGY